MKTTMTNTPSGGSNPQDDGPVLDVRWIETCVHLDQGLDMVKARHTEIHNAYAADRRSELSARLKSSWQIRDSAVKDLETLDDQLKRHVPRIKNPAAGSGEKRWDFGSRAAYAVTLTGMLALLGASLYTMSSYLIASGVSALFITQPWSAYLVAGIPLASPLVLSFLYEELPKGGRARQIFIPVLVASGTVCMAVFVVLFATQFGKIGQSSAELIAEVLEETKGPRMGPLMVIFQVFGELLYSTVLKLKLGHMWDARRPLLIQSEEHAAISAEKVKAEAWVRQQNHAIDAVQSEISDMDSARDGFVNKAVLHFEELRSIAKRIKAIRQRVREETE